MKIIDHLYCISFCIISFRVSQHVAFTAKLSDSASVSFKLFSQSLLEYDSSTSLQNFTTLLILRHSATVVSFHFYYKAIRAGCQYYDTKQLQWVLQYYDNQRLYSILVFRHPVIRVGSIFHYDTQRLVRNPCITIPNNWNGFLVL